MKDDSIFEEKSAIGFFSNRKETNKNPDKAEICQIQSLASISLLFAPFIFFAYLKYTKQNEVHVKQLDALILQFRFQPLIIFIKHYASK